MSGNTPSGLRQQKKLAPERLGKGPETAKNGGQMLFCFCARNSVLNSVHTHFSKLKLAGNEFSRSNNAG
jgi:hypothetical protein